MSILSIAYLREGIVMASDCRGTFGKEINGVMEYRTADRAPKTFLINSINVGISYCGNMWLEPGKLFHNAIKKFVDNNVQENDTAYTVAEKILNRYANNKTTFLIAGYIGIEQHIYVVNNTISRLNKKSDILQYGIKPFGMTDSVIKLINEKYVGVDCNRLTLNEGICITEEWIECAIKNEESCGYPISVLVIQPQGSTWIRRNGITQDI